MPVPPEALVVPVRRLVPEAVDEAADDPLTDDIEVRRMARWPNQAIGVLSVVALGVLCSADAKKDSVATPSGVSTVEHVRLNGVALTGERTLHLDFTGSPGPSDPPRPCELAYQADVAETSEAVTVSVHGSTIVPTRYLCALVGTSRSVDVTLASPVGHRRIVDSASGSEFAPFDESALLRPAWLPDGWSLLWQNTGDGPGLHAASQRTFGPPLPMPLPEPCTGAGTPVLVLQVDDASVGALAVPDGFEPAGTAIVHGRAALLARSAHQTAMVWSTGSQTVGLFSMPRCADDAPTSFDVLQHIADGLG